MYSKTNVSPFDHASDDDRVDFVRKVYSILLLMLCITCGIVAMFMSIDSLRNYILGDGWWLWIPCMIISIICQVCIYFCVGIRRRIPLNYIIVLIFTLTFSWIPASAAVSYSWQSPNTVYQAAILTVGITMAVTAYAWFERVNFRIVRGILFVLGFAMLWFGIVGLVFGMWLPTLYCTLALIVWGLYLLLDTSFIIGRGHHKMEIDDFAFGSMILFVDVIMIFVYLLRLLGRR